MGVSISYILVLMFASMITDRIMGSSENQQLTTATNTFALELHQDLRNESENMIVSPCSIQFLMGMVLEGAHGETATEIAKVLHYEKNDVKILEGYRAMIKGLESPDLKIATRMFVEKTIGLKPNFTELTSKYFLSEIQSEDFKKSPEGARNDINNWAEEKTNHKIKDLLPPGTIESTTRLVLVNAIHFKADWKKKFDKKDTIEMPFYVTPTDTVNVQMMVMREGKFRYTESPKLDAKIIELPYAGDVFSMIILLPNKLDGLSEMEDKLKSLDLSEELTPLYEQTVNVMVPRFKIEKTMDLNDVFIKKMPTAFSDMANFTGISDEPLKISKIIQKAFIEVNEEGTEAAAASGIHFQRRKKISQLLCDRPFMILITHYPTGSVLFTSRLQQFQ